MVKIHQLLLKLTESLFVVVSLSIIIGVYVGLYFPDFVAEHPNISLTALAAIFFLSALKIDMKKVLQALADKWMLAVVIFFMLFALPFVVFHVTNYLYPTIAISLLLLSAMPSGMTAPLLSELAGGKQSLALVLTVVTSLLAPITVPLVVQFTAGTVVAVDSWGMFIRLVQVIFIPFLIAQVLKYYFQPAINAVAPAFKSVSTVLLGILILFVIAKQPHEIVALFQGGESVVYLSILFLFFAVLHILGYITVFWRHKRDRVTIAVCLTYMNFTLAITLASEFFKEPNIVVPTILSVLPWAIMFIPFRMVVKKMGLLSP
jgi:BASS family bile acid:Na+ symporter